MPAPIARPSTRARRQRFWPSMLAALLGTAIVTALVSVAFADGCGPCPSRNDQWVRREWIEQPY